MVTSITSAENVLKSVYLGVLANQLNTTVSPFFSKIKQTSADVWGKNIVKLAPYGLNGGVGAGTETGSLPEANGNNYVQFTLSLKNLYGNIEISDKAIRASQNSAGAFVNLLNAEMEGLLKASKFNLGRMLLGDGVGKLATTVSDGTNTNTTVVKVNDLRMLEVGMAVDLYNGISDSVAIYAKRRILAMDRTNNRITISGAAPSAVIGAGYYLTMQGSKDNEITGLGAIFKNSGTLYGVDRSQNKWLIPYMRTSAGPISSSVIQTAVDYIDQIAGSPVDFILTSYDVRRFYLDYLSLTRTNIDYMNLDGGFKALSYNGIPLFADRFASDGTMYLLNSADFKLHQLCDWQWLEGDNGKILLRKTGTPNYSATLVKYADLICDRPVGQAKISGITAASTGSGD